MDNEERQTFGHLMNVDLSDDEIKSQLERNADIDRKMLLIKAEKAAANSGFNEDLKTLRKEQVTLLESVSSGKTKVEVECYLDKDLRLNVMRTLRADNGEQVDERALTADELNEDRQGSLFEGDKKPASPDDASGGDEDEDEDGDEDTEATLAEYEAQHTQAHPSESVDEPVVN